MLYSFDLHLHTYYSADACDSPETMVAMAKKKGLSGIAITDHDSCESFDQLIKNGLMREDGEAEDNFLIIPGVEVSTDEGHLLCLGTCLPNMKGQPALKVVHEIRQRGGIPVVPHPFDFLRSRINPAIIPNLSVSVIEIFNAAVPLKKFNDQALKYSIKHQFASIAGSDAHHASAVGVCSTSYDLNKLTLNNVLAAISRGGECQCQYLGYKETAKKIFSNWFRFLETSNIH